jgi:hypothetical protein
MSSSAICRNDEFVAQDRFQPKVPSSLVSFRQLNDESIMSFGVHAGKKLKAVPARYWDFLRDTAWLEADRPAVHDYLVRNERAIDKELEDEERRSERRH